MVNEGLPKLKKQPLTVRTEKQLKGKGIPAWAPAALD
jgi:hypothetical protein